jgi:long-subunit acyl-CoA synthetase (AMP-forming)
VQGESVSEPASGEASTSVAEREPPALRASTICEAFEITAAELGDRVAIRTRNDAQTLTWSQWRDRARDLAGGLHKLGLRRGQTLAIMISNRPEFHVASVAPVWASQHGLVDLSPQQLSGEPAVRTAVQEGIDAANSRMARVEQIKKFQIISGDWLPGGEELTPTMKLKRKPIAEKYAAEIDAMYA